MHSPIIRNVLQNKHKKTKASFSRLLWHPAWKRRGSIFISALHKFVTYLLRHLPTYNPATHMGLTRELSKRIRAHVTHWRHIMLPNWQYWITNGSSKYRHHHKSTTRLHLCMITNWLPGKVTVLCQHSALTYSAVNTVDSLSSLHRGHQSTW